MATLKELHEQKARIATNARAKFDEITDDTKPERAKEIETEFDAMMAEHDEIGAKAERLAKLEGVERDMLGAAEREEQEKREGKRPNLPAGKVEPGAEMDYRTAFHSYLRAQGNVAAMDSEARAVLESGYSQIESRAQTTTAAAGGYTVPTELSNILVKSMLAWGPMYDPGITTELVTSGGGQILMPTVNDTASVVVKHTEGTTLTDDGGSDVTFAQKQLDAYAFNTEWLRVSKELADDSIFAMETLLGNLLGERLGRRANLELTTGDGTGDPNGIVTASAEGKVAASSSAITADEIIDLIHSVDPAYRSSPRTAFQLNDATLAAIYKLKDGDGNYLLSEGNFTTGIPGTIRGYRYHVNQAVSGLGDGVNSRVMIFGDMSKYFVRKVGSPLIGAIQDKDFWPGFGIAGYIRFDGELSDTAAVKHMALAAA
jgi:HK97 family phage major capsid protein